MKKIIVTLTLILSITATASAAEIPRETAPITADENAIAIVENLIFDILDEVQLGNIGYAIASNEADKRIRKAVFADETNGYGYAILSVIANNTIRTMRDMYLRPEAYERYEAYLRELLADILVDVSNGRDFDDAWDAAHTRMYQAINPSYTPRGFAMDFCYMDTPAIDMAMYNRAHKLLSEYRPQ